MDESDNQTVPLDESFRETVVYHNRVYQQYALESGAYFAPVDDVSLSADVYLCAQDLTEVLISPTKTEVERLQMMHSVFSLMFDGRLIFPPIANPRRILDCGSGAASWAEEVAQRYPECEVIGIDIYPYRDPNDLPPNLDLQIDNLNNTSTFGSNYFDLVHSRMMAGGIDANRWVHYLRDILRVLVPGGWCQMVEIYFNAQSDNGTLTENHALSVWSQSLLRSLELSKDPRAPMRLQNWMQSVGFEQVESRVLTLPLSGWSADRRDHANGLANRENVHRLLSSLAVYPFTQFLGASTTDVELLAAQARSEADNPAFRAYFPVYVCIGRKPGSSSRHRGTGHKGHHSHQSSKNGKSGDSRKRARYCH